MISSPAPPKANQSCPGDNGCLLHTLPWEALVQPLLLAAVPITPPDTWW